MKWFDPCLEMCAYDEDKSKQDSEVPVESNQTREYLSRYYYTKRIDYVMVIERLCAQVYT